jgi:hypothetical protein
MATIDFIVRIISLRPVELIGRGVNDRFLIAVIQGGHDATLSSSLHSTRMWRSTERWRSAVGFTTASVMLSLLRLIQISKISRPLRFLGRHERPVGAEKVRLSVDADMMIVSTQLSSTHLLRVGNCGDNVWSQSKDASRHGRTRVTSLLMTSWSCRRYSASPHPAVAVAVALRVDPTADGNPGERWIHIGRKVAPVGKDAAAVEPVEDQDGECFRRYDELDLAIAIGHTRHPRRKAPSQVCLEDRLIPGRERRVLSEAPRLVWVRILPSRRSPSIGPSSRDIWFHQARSRFGDWSVVRACRRDRWPADIRPLSPRRVQPPRSKRTSAHADFKPAAGKVYSPVAGDPVSPN